MPFILRLLGFVSSGTTVGACIGSGSNTALASAAAFAAAIASAAAFLFSALLCVGSFCFPINLILSVGGFAGGGVAAGAGSGIGVGSTAGFGNPLSACGFTKSDSLFHLFGWGSLKR